jgi:hypothetical protein
MFNFNFDVNKIVRRSMPVYLRDSKFLNQAWIQTLISPIQGIEYVVSYSTLKYRNTAPTDNFSITITNENNDVNFVTIDFQYETAQIKQYGDNTRFINFNSSHYDDTNIKLKAIQFFLKLYTSEQFPNIKFDCVLEDNELTFYFTPLNKYTHNTIVNMNIKLTKNNISDVEIFNKNLQSTHKDFIEYKNIIDEELSRTNNVINLQYKLNKLYDKDFIGENYYYQLSNSDKIRIIHILNIYDNYTRFSTETSNHIIIGMIGESLSTDQVYIKYSSENTVEFDGADFLVEIHQSIEDQYSSYDVIKNLVIAYVNKYKAGGTKYIIPDDYI